MVWIFSDNNGVDVRIVCVFIMFGLICFYCVVCVAKTTFYHIKIRVARQRIPVKYSIFEEKGHFIDGF